MRNQRQTWGAQSLQTECFMPGGLAKHLVVHCKGESGLFRSSTDQVCSQSDSCWFARLNREAST